MAIGNGIRVCFLLLVYSLLVHMAMSEDPDILTDFAPPPSTTLADANFFTYTAMRGLMGAPPPQEFKGVKASMAEFPALNGQGVSYEVSMYPAGSVSPVHMHPHSAKLLFVLQGSLKVGFVDTENKVYDQTLQVGDMFLFPKGLVHYQYNADEKNPALAISAFGSANPGTEEIPNNLFNTTIGL